MGWLVHRYTRIEAFVTSWMGFFLIYFLFYIVKFSVCTVL